MIKNIHKNIFVTSILVSSFVFSSVSVYAKDEVRHSFYGIVDDHGIECPEQGFKLVVPDDYEIENRGTITFNGETSELDPNEEKTFEALDIGIDFSKFFEAKNDQCTISIYLSEPGYGYSGWGDLGEIAQNGCDTFVADMEEDPDYYEGQGSSSADTFLGKSCYVNRFSSKLYDYPYYTTVIYLLDDTSQFLTRIYLDSWDEDLSATLTSYFTGI